MLLSSKPVTSWRCVLKVLVKQGPVQFSTTVVRKVNTLFCAGYHFVTVVRIHADFSNRVVLWILPRRFVVNHAENIFTQARSRWRLHLLI